MIGLVSSLLNPVAAPAVAGKGEDGGVLQKQASGYEIVLKREPSNLNALLGLAEIRRKQGRVQDTIALLKQAQQSSPDPSLTMNIAQLYQQTGQPILALAEYDAVLRAVPDYAPALLGKAITLKIAGQIKPAQELYLKALEKAPKEFKPQITQAFESVPVPAPAPPAPASVPPAPALPKK